MRVAMQEQMRMHFDDEAKDALARGGEDRGVWQF